MNPSCMGVSLIQVNVCRDKITSMLREVMWDTMQVFDFGAQKHPDSGDTPNFLTPDGNKCSLKVRGSSVLRHAARTFMHPEMVDEESNLPELLHLLASASILYIRKKRNIDHPDDEECNHQKTHEREIFVDECAKCEKVIIREG